MKLHLATCLAFCVAGNANALLIQTDRDSFLDAAAAATVTLEDFDGFAAGAAPTTAGVSYSASQGSVLVTNEFLTTSLPNGIGSDSPDTGQIFFQSDETVTLTFASAVTAFAIDINTFGDLDGDYTAQLNTGETATSLFDTFPVIGGAGFATGQFLGFITDTPFTSLQIGSINDGRNLTYTLDTLIFGAAEDVVDDPFDPGPDPTGVPAPATLGLLAAALLGVGFGRRRRPFFTG